jgi:cobaltochelatase CobS
MTVLSNPVLVKHSQRSTRKGCLQCGRTDSLYWGHDTTRPHYSTCERCNVNGKFVLIEADGSLHACFANGETSSQEPDHSDVNEPAHVITSMRGSAQPNLTGAIAQQSTSPAPDKTDAGAQLASLIGRLAQGTVDEATVRSMIKGELGSFSADMIETVGGLVSDKLASLTVPTVLEIHKPGGEVKELKGVHKDVPKILAAIQASENVLMVGPMGTGKSTIAKHIADAMDVPFEFMAVGPQASDSKILGYMTADGTYVPTWFRRVYESGGIGLFDELDAAHPGVLTVINAALSNGHMAFPDGLITRHPDAYFMAAANTYGRGPDRMYVGRQAIDAATLDRFCVVDVDVDEALESAMCYSTGLDASKVDDVLTYVRTLRKNAEANKMAVGFSPRASHGMCKLINAGWSLQDAIQSRVRRGLSEQDWSKVTRGSIMPRG